MQLTRRAEIVTVLAFALSVVVTRAPRAWAEPSVGAGAGFFHEAGGPLHMTVLTPGVDAAADIGAHLQVNASWAADMVSGASVAVVDAPASSVDAVTSASVHDTRHVFGGGLRLAEGNNTLSAGYHYAFENDYRSHTVEARARTELYEHNTAFEVAYARAFDHVCDAPDASNPTVKGRLASSDGCFEDQVNRRSRPLDTHSFLMSWTQLWTPVLSSQITGTAQLLDGFQSNPYRAVNIGRVAAQEHHPENRARYALGMSFRIWVRPFDGALQPSFRVYRDTWDILSFSAELGYEQRLFAGLRLRGRGRYYTQGSAAFYSDDYVLSPKGQYFTGDRELSPMHSVMVGAQLSWIAPQDENGDALGMFQRFEVVAKADALQSFFPEFHYDRVGVPNRTAMLLGLSLLAGF